MRPTFARSRRRSEGARAVASWWRVLALALSGCGQVDGVVGKVDSTPIPAVTATFVEDFASNTGVWRNETTLPGAAAPFGVVDENALDQRAAELVFPGHPEFAANDKVGAEFATQIATSRRFHFGTYRTRMKFGACATSEQAVSAFLGYFSDGSDQNQNGITDDVEIDMQVVCGAPQFLYLTVFTDYEVDGSGVERFRKLTRVIDFSNGNVFDTPAPDQDGFSKTGQEPSLMRAGALATGEYHELGFEWHATSLRFFLVLEGSELTLWNLTDPARIPSAEVTIMYNIWHPDSQWYPKSGSADFPAHDVTLSVDWLRFYAE